jgi:hypothetical protein
MSVLDATLACLAHQQRRHVLYHLREETVVSVEELATELAAHEAGRPPEEVTDQQRRTAQTSLVHNHLPKLVEANLVEYDGRTGTVRHSEPPALLAVILRLLAELEPEDDYGGT